MAVPDREHRLAIAADVLTFVRGAIAVVLIPVLGRDDVTAAAVLVGLAWLSDAADGRLARASGMTTALGPWDLDADTAVGAAIVLGLTVSGWLGWWLGIGLVGVLAGAFLVTRNEAMSMSIQAIGYALLAWRTWSDGHTIAFVWMVAVVAGIAVVNRRVFRERSVPTFLEGIATVFGTRRSA